MQRDRVISLLREHEPEFRRSGVAALFLFGSTGRGTASDDSDVDVFFEPELTRRLTLFDLAALQERMQDILGIKVDLMTRGAIHPRRRDRIEASALRVF